MRNSRGRKGFTLIELLIVIAIIAVLAVAVVLTLNPAQLLKQARDSTRIADLASLKSALALYLSDSSSPNLGGGNCYAHSSSTLATCNVSPGSGPARFTNSGAATVSVLRAVDGTGWLPVNFNSISSGGPLSIEPVDPVNNSTYFYAYAPGPNKVYELNADMESTKFDKGGSGDVESNDGGNDPDLLEVGTSPGLSL